MIETLGAKMKENFGKSNRPTPAPPGRRHKNPNCQFIGGCIHSWGGGQSSTAAVHSTGGGGAGRRDVGRLGGGGWERKESPDWSTLRVTLLDADFEHSFSFLFMFAWTPVAQPSQPLKAFMNFQDQGGPWADDADLCSLCGWIWILSSTFIWQSKMCKAISSRLAFSWCGSVKCFKQQAKAKPGGLADFSSGWLSPHVTSRSSLTL